MQQAVACVSKSFDLEFGRLAGENESGIAVRQHRLDFELRIIRDDDHQRLRRLHDPTDRVNRQLLDRTGDGCAELLQAGALRRLDQLLPLLGRVLGGLAQCVEGLTAELRGAGKSALGQSGSQRTRRWGEGDSNRRSQVRNRRARRSGVIASPMRPAAS